MRVLHRLSVLVMSLMAAACNESHARREQGSRPVIVSTGGSPSAVQAGGTASKTCGRRDEPAPGDGSLARERCNDWDDDCDGEIDEDFDHDGDGYSTCRMVSPRVDCDDQNPLIHPDHPELCDDLDNDCDEQWDESCPTPHCGRTKECPDGLACVEVGGACIEPKSCEDVEKVETTCDAPEDLLEPGDCNPTQCGRFQNGTCWGTCECAADGVYRWRVGCTE